MMVFSRFSRCKDWCDVRGDFYIECGFVDGKLINAHNDKELPKYLSEELLNIFSDFDITDAVFEIDIEFSSTGYYDEGKISGPPEYCYPPEGDDERTLVGCTVILYLDDYEIIKSISTKTSDLLFEEFYEEIMDKPLDFDFDFNED